MIIGGGTIVTVNVGTAASRNLTINGELDFNNDINLDVNGDFTNNGTFSAGTGNSSVSFKGGNNNTISGSSNSAFNNIIVNKGTGITSVLEASGTGAISNTANLTLTSGLFKATTGIYQFTSDPNIPNAAGLWVSGATVNSVSGGAGFSIDNNGLVRVSSGILNVGTATGNELHTATGGSLLVEGGTVNIAGRLVNSAGDITVTGGTINISTIGHSNVTFASFDLSLSTNLTISGNPSIIFQNANAGTAGDINIVNSTGTKTITGGVFQLGNASTPAGSVFKISSVIPFYNLSIFNNNAAGSLATNDLTVFNQLTLNGPLSLNNQNLVLSATAPGIAGTIGSGNGMIITNGTGEARKIFSNSSPSFAYSFFVGTSATQYSPFNISFTSGTYTPTSYAGVRGVNAKHPSNSNTNNYLNRYWSLNVSGITSPVYNVTATYDPATWLAQSRKWP